MKKNICLSLFMLLSLIFSACAASNAQVITAPEAEPTAEPVTINYYTWSAFPRTATDPNHQADLEEMVRIFEASHPNIKVNIIKADWDNYRTKLKAMLMGGGAPDVIEMNPEYFVEYASYGILLDLNPYMQADQNFDKTIFYPASLAAFQQGGHQLGIPETFSTVVLVYNKDMFDKAGVAYPTEDWTWQDAIEAAQQLDDPENGIYGLYSGLSYWEFYKKAAQNNCKFFNQDQTAVTINSPECVEALQLMVDLVNKHNVMPSAAEMGSLQDGDLFLKQQLGMTVTGIWMFEPFKAAEFNWDIAVEPGMSNHATHFFTNAVTVFAATKHPQEAWEWVKFFTSSQEMSQIRLDSSWELPAVNNPEYVKTYLEITPPANRQVVYDSLKYATVAPTIRRQSEMIAIIEQYIQKVALEQLTSQEALDQVKEEIEALIAE